MENFSQLEILKNLASYGVLGLGWFAWILTMVYLQSERRRYQNLVLHIIDHFTKVNRPTQPSDTDAGTVLDGLFDKKTTSTFNKLFKGDK